MVPKFPEIFTIYVNSSNLEPNFARTATVVISLRIATVIAS